MTAGQTRVRVPIDHDTQVAVRRIEGQPLAITIQAGTVLLDLILTSSGIAAIQPAGLLADASKRLEVEARVRAGQAVA